MTTTEPIKKPRQRILALDILRGITIAGMIMVNNPGSWGAIYAPLKHASWHGLTPTDLVFPFFMFIMGISTYISLRKYNFTYSHDTLVKIVKRTIVIFLIGLAIGWFSRFCYGLARADEALSLGERILNAANSFGTLRILGVMQRLALCYCAASIIAITVKHVRIPYIIAGILVVYSALLLLFNGLEFSLNNIIYTIDHALFGDAHLYKDTVSSMIGTVQSSSEYSLQIFQRHTYPIDPEGLLSTLPSIAHVLIGFCCGQIIVNVKDNNLRVMNFFIIGTILTFVGFLFSYGMPINKKLWTPTFALTTGTFERRRYLGVFSRTTDGKPASLSFILPLSITRMLTCCAAAAIISSCSACFFCAFLPRKYRTTRAISSTARITSNTIVILLTGFPPQIIFTHSLL